MFIVSGAQVLGSAWNFLGVPESINKWVLGLDPCPTGVITICWIIMLIGGCIMDGVSLLVLSTPILLPLATSKGFSPIWFGVMMGMLIGCGQITPPVGMSLFTVKAIFPKEKFGVIVLGSMPFFIAELICIAVNTAWPQISLWLPGVIYGH